MEYEIVDGRLEPNPVPSRDGVPAVVVLVALVLALTPIWLMLLFAVTRGGR